MQNKVIFIGDSFTGKSSLIANIMKETFKQNRSSTISCGFHDLTIDHKGKQMSLKIWDTIGHEKYRSLTRTYYRGASCAVVVFDLCNDVSFQSLGSWISDLRDEVDDVSIILVGNKSDLEDSREVSRQTAEAYANLHECQYVETSAINDDGTDELINLIASLMETKTAYMQTDTANMVPRQPTTGKKCC